VRHLLFICGTAGVRLDRAILEKINELEGSSCGISRNRIQSLVEMGCVKRNGAELRDNARRLSEGDEISVEMGDPPDLAPKAENIELDILYEDSELLVLNKQAGLTVHPGAGVFAGTLVNALLEHCGGNLSDLAGPERPGIVHRLDRDTSGLMVVAKNNFSHDSLGKQLRARELKRVYSAFLWGTMVPRSGKIEGFIARHRHNRLKMVMAEDGRYSLTSYRTLAEFKSVASWVECSLSTGRTHQLRVHFSSKKHPLIGDRLYGGAARKIAGKANPYKDFVEKFPRQALHSMHLDFRHPITSRPMSFETVLPEDMEKLLGNLREISKCDDSRSDG
jgi:23S rRNA pseudouridine1911/1915/1917 synthase